MPWNDEWLWGIKGGPSLSTFQDLKNTLIDPDRLIERNFSREYWRRGYEISLFSHGRLKKSPLIYLPQISFSRQGGDYKLNIADTFYYHSQFKYDYINIIPIYINWHPALQGDARDATALAGFHVGIGLNIGIIFNDGITYNSHEPHFDLAITQAMNDALKGKSQVAILFGVGYEYFFEKGGFGFRLEGKYSYGVGDSIQTLESSFGYSETKVSMQVISGSLGIMFRLNEK